MVQAILTSFEGDYHLGVGALLNSAIRAGFVGEFHVYCRGERPPWSRQFDATSTRGPAISGVSLFFHVASRDRHFGYDKPFQALELLALNEKIDSLYYFDPDVVVLCPWRFLADWVTSGVGAILDCNAPIVPADHPWRATWRRLSHLAPHSPDSARTEPFYANSGFFCLARKQKGFLERWVEITESFEGGGGNVQCFQLDKRWLAVTGDQDLFAAAVESWNGPISLVGPDGMGFNGHYWLLSHATEQPKPWKRFCLRESLGARPPKRTVDFYLQNANGAVQTMHKLQLACRRVDYKLARAIGCIVSRPNC